MNFLAIKFYTIGAALLLLLSVTHTSKDSLKVAANTYKAQNNLTAYLNHIFDITDENPQLATLSADSIFTTIWREPKTIEEKLAYYHVLVNFGYHQLSHRQISESIKWYEKAYHLYEQNRQDSALTNEMEFEEYVCKPLGNNYNRMGDFSRAIFVQTTAIKTATQKNRLQVLPGLYGNLASTYYHMQHYDSVQQITNTALATLTLNNGQRINVYNIKTQAFLDEGLTDSAAFWNNKAQQLTLLVKKEYADVVIIALINQAKILLHHKKFTAAIKVLHKAQTLSGKAYITESIETAIELGNAYLLNGNTDSSIRWHKTALGYFKLNADGLHPDFKVTTALFGIAAATLKNDPVFAASVFEKAVINDYYTQQLIPSSLNSKTAAYANNQYSEVAIALHHQLFRQTKENAYLEKALWLAELSKGRKLLNEHEKNVQRNADAALQKNKYVYDQLKNLYLSLNETTDALALQSIQQKIQTLEYSLNIKENQSYKTLTQPKFEDFKNWMLLTSASNTLLSYYVGQSYIYTIKVQNKKITHSVDSMVNQRRQSIATFVNDYFLNGPEGFNNNPDAYKTASFSLLQHLLPNYSDCFNSIYISADDILHELPFEALCTDSTTFHYFGEDKAVNYNVSFLQNINNSAFNRENVRLKIFSFGQSHLGFPALPSSVNEKNFLKTQFKSEVYDAANTSSEAFAQILQTGDVIHFASHAVATPGNTQPYLVLQNKLYLGNLQFASANCPLIVLAACETGKGILQKGEGMQSLGRALVVNGVEGVITTRWEVDDEAVSTIIQLFYKHLQKTAKPAQALQLARLDFLKGTTSVQLKNPWLWAALQYQGTNKNISITASPSYKMPLIAAGVAVLLVLLFIMKRGRFMVLLQ